MLGFCKILAILGQILKKILKNPHFTCWDLNLRHFHYLKPFILGPNTLANRTFNYFAKPVYLGSCTTTSAAPPTSVHVDGRFAACTGGWGCGEMPSGRFSRNSNRDVRDEELIKVTDAKTLLKEGRFDTDSVLGLNTRRCIVAIHSSNQQQQCIGFFSAELN